MMFELLCGLGMMILLYWLGGIWMPEHRPIQQELMKVIEDE